jgi:predicted transcriptional regulator/5S rRNA maturation endonuclease (ribonuclease M5)
MPKPTNYSKFFSVYTAQDVPENHEGEYRLDCPLVGCENPEQHFYANCSDGTWHCKRCDKSGNARTLITNIWQQNYDSTEQHHYDFLAKVRGIPSDIFQECGWAFDTANNRWLVPYFTYDPEKGEWSDFLNNLGYFYPYSTSKDRFTIKKSGALPLYLYNPGWHNLPPSNTTVICEGEWDTLAYMAANLDSSELILGKSGAGFNKSYMKTLSKTERVILLLDNDSAGRAQTAAATEIIAETVPSIYGIDWDLVDWPTEYTGDKKDVRDLYKAVGLQSYSKIERALVKSDTTTTTAPVNKTTQGAVYQTNLADFKQVESFDNYLATAKSFLYMTDETAAAMAATIGITNSIIIPGEPLWAFLIGPPASGKTTFIDSFGGNNERFDNLSKISAKALVSGWRDDDGSEPSYLAKLKDKTLFVKDFTVTLTDSQDSQREVFGLLTDIFDGYVKIPYGNNQVREFYDLYFNMVAGVTDIVHSHSAASIGERFLRIDFLGRNYKARQFASAALANFGKSKPQKEALTKNTLGFVNYLKSMPFPMEIPGEYHDPIIDLAEFIATIRTKVESDRLEGIKYRPRTELPSRLSLQLAKLFVSVRTVYNQDPNKEEPTIAASRLAFDVVKKVAFDTCYGFSLDLVKAIHVNPGATRDILAAKANIHQQKAYRILDDLITTGVITKANGQAGVKGGRPAHLYSINPKLKTVLDHDAQNTQSTTRRPIHPSRRP